MPISPKPLLGNQIGYADLYNYLYSIEIETIGFFKNLLLELNQYTINKQSEIVGLTP